MSGPMQIDRLREALRTSSRITILTGAGVSAASGIPTFRGAGGLWRTFRPEDLATPEAFDRDPRLVWEWYDWRRALVANAVPNPAHTAIQALMGRPGRTLITQNVDGLHERSGTTDVLRLHGSIWRLRCVAQCQGGRDWEDVAVPLVPLPPHCPNCGALARPAIVWFGESLDPAVLTRAREACACDLFLSIGTSSLVHPAAGLLSVARAAGAVTCEINPEATPASRLVDFAIAAPAEQVLPRVVSGLADRL
jgi:NAD-dependent deacetylase